MPFLTTWNRLSFVLGGSAPGNMIMDGLETLVAPTHHAFLLTESAAAAAHFNVLSFDTCLFKPTSSFATTNLLGSVTTAAATHPQLQQQQHQHLNHHHQHQHHHHQQQQPSNLNLQTAEATGNSSNSNSNNNASHPSSNSSSSNGTESSGSNRMANSLGAPTITILDNGNGSALSQSKGTNEVETAQGDLNTPVTTANDLPSFFGPSTVVEPPPITGELHMEW